jgi:hypothetical protein
MTSVCLTGHGMRCTTLPESLFGHIIALLAKHEAEHSLTAEIVEELARAYAACPPAAFRTNRN